MHVSVVITGLLASAACVDAFYPITRHSHHSPAVTTKQLLTIAPNASSCDDPPAPGECATAAEAAPVINNVFSQYRINTRGAQAALLSLMAFETADFKYNRNHFPGVPGQGTRNMQSPAFNKLYADSIPMLHNRTAPENVNATLDLLLANPRWDFGSAAWFFTTQCNNTVQQGVQNASVAGWEAYIEGCVGTTVTEDRRAYWERAVDALLHD